MSQRNIHNYHSSCEEMQKVIEMVEKILPVHCDYDKNSTNSQTFEFWVNDGIELSNSKIHYANQIIGNIIAFCRS